MKKLYKQIAKLHNTTPKEVEKEIKKAIAASHFPYLSPEEIFKNITKRISQEIPQ